MRKTKISVVERRQFLLHTWKRHAHRASWPSSQPRGSCCPCSPTSCLHPNSTGCEQGTCLSHPTTADLPRTGRDSAIPLKEPRGISRDGSPAYGFAPDRPCSGSPAQLTPKASAQTCTQSKQEETISTGPPTPRKQGRRGEGGGQPWCFRYAPTTAIHSALCLVFHTHLSDCVQKVQL